MRPEPASSAGGNRGWLALQREDGGNVGVPAAPNVGQIAGVGLEMGRVAGVVGDDDTVDIGSLHCPPRKAPAAVAFFVAEIGIGEEIPSLAVDVLALVRAAGAAGGGLVHGWRILRQIVSPRNDFDGASLLGLWFR